MGRLDYLSGLVIAQDDPGAMILVKIFVPEIKRAEESASQVLTKLLGPGRLDPSSRPML